MPRYDLPEVHISGSPRDMGRAYGEALRDQISTFVPHRLSATKVYLGARGFDREPDLLAAGAACLASLKAWDEPGWEELVGTAEGARVEPEALYAAANYSDVRDLVLLGEVVEVGIEEGCTSIAIPRSASENNTVIAAQTWDLHPKDLDYVVAVHRKPTDGPETWAITTAGAPTLIGINEHGLYVGTTNLKVKGVRPGVPYLSILHRAARCKDHKEAAAIVEQAPRVAAHSFWFADERGAVELECSADRCVRREMASDPLIQTNHCLDAQHQEAEAEPPSASSLHRLRRTQALVHHHGPHTVETIQLMFQDRMDGINSINRYPEDEQIAATNACAIAVPSERTLYACRGPADQGEWKALKLSA